MSAAASCYKATLSVTTGLSAPFNNLAIIYKQQVIPYHFLYLFHVLNSELENACMKERVILLLKKDKSLAL